MGCLDYADKQFGEIIGNMSGGEYEVSVVFIIMRKYGLYKQMGEYVNTQTPVRLFTPADIAIRRSAKHINFIVYYYGAH